MPEPLDLTIFEGGGGGDIPADPPSGGRDLPPFALKSGYGPAICILLLLGLSLNFARTLGHAVDKLLNGSRVNSHGQFIFGKP